MLAAEEDKRVVGERVKAEESRPKFGIEIYRDQTLPVNVRVALLREHGCDFLADDLVDKEPISGGEKPAGHGN